MGWTFVSSSTAAVRQLALAGRAQADQSCDDQILEWQLSSGAAAVRGINPSTGLTAAFHLILFYSHPLRSLKVFLSSVFLPPHVS